MIELTDHFWEEESRELELACNTAGLVTWADARARRRLAVEAGRPLTDVVSPSAHDKVQTLLHRACSEPVRGYELSLLVNGRVATYSFCARPDGKGGVRLLGTSLPDEVETAYRELDESNRGVITLHAELADKAEMLRRTAEVKSRVMANVSHELRTPLHTILGLSKLLLDDSESPLTDEQQKQVRFIRSSAEELNVMVGDILDVSKAEAGKMVLRPTRFCLGEFFAGLRGALRPLLDPSTQVTLNFRTEDDALELETDEGKVAQILRNLITNAVKFTEQGEVEVSATSAGGDVVMRVRDTGVGIAREHFEQIFEEFGQVDNPLQKKVKGTGLGLALSRRLAEILGGTLTVDSVLGKGSTFTLRLPRVHPESHEMARIAEQPLDPTRSPVLVVEDDRKSIFVYERYLSLAGFQVIPARTIADASRVLQRVRPCAIVLDVMLEGETTWDFMASLKRSPTTADIPVMVVTVTNREQKARALGADEFWLKPVDQDRLLRKLKSIARTDATARVLLIDDDERSRYLVRKLLERSGFALLEADNGPEGVRMARESRPDIILLDFLLQQSTAFDVLDDLKADPRTRALPVIIITSHVLEEDERERLAAQAQTILAKETLSRELAINRIRDALRKAGLGGSAPMIQSGS